jgi:hypothetical protein
MVGMTHCDDEGESYVYKHQTCSVMYMEMEAANASSYKIALNMYTLYIY